MNNLVICCAHVYPTSWVENITNEGVGFRWRYEHQGKCFYLAAISGSDFCRFRHSRSIIDSKFIINVSFIKQRTIESLWKIFVNNSSSVPRFNSNLPFTCLLRDVILWTRRRVRGSDTIYLSCVRKDAIPNLARIDKFCMLKI